MRHAEPLVMKVQDIVGRQQVDFGVAKIIGAKAPIKALAAEPL